jgi:hypothetical protein
VLTGCFGRRSRLACWAAAAFALGTICFALGAISSNAILHPTPLRGAAPSPSPAVALPRPVSAAGVGSVVYVPFHLTASKYLVTWTPVAHDDFIVHLDWGAETASVLPQRMVSSGKLAFNVPIDTDFTLKAQTPPTISWSITFTPIQP